MPLFLRRRVLVIAVSISLIIALVAGLILSLSSGARASDVVKTAGAIETVGDPIAKALTRTEIAHQTPVSAITTPRMTMNPAEPSETPTFMPTKPSITREGTFSPAATPDSSTAVAIQTTPIPVLIRTEAGRFLGFGEAILYGPATLRIGEVAIYRLQLTITQLEVNDIREPTRVASPLPRTPIPSPTPLPIAGQVGALDIYEIMGAQLKSNAPGKLNITPLRDSPLLAVSVYSVNYWQWTIDTADTTPIGKQTLSAYFFLPQRKDDGTTLERPVGDPITFTLDIQPAQNIPNPPPAPSPDALSTLLIGVFGLAVLVALGSSVMLFRLRGRRTAFISYRRAVSSQLAQTICEKLRKYGVDAFFDTEEVSAAGRFADRLLTAIKQADVFIALLGGTTLESEWCLKEIEHAANLGKIMIPVFQESYAAPKPPIPEAVQNLLNYDGLPILDVRNVYIEETIQRLAEMIHKARRNR